MSERERSFSIRPAERGLQMTTVTTVTESVNTYGQAASQRLRLRNLSALKAASEGFLAANAVVFAGVNVIEVLNEFFLRGEGADLQKLVAGAVVGAVGLALGSEARENVDRANDAWDDETKLTSLELAERKEVINANRFSQHS